MLFVDAELADGRVRDVRVRDGTIAAVEADLSAGNDERAIDAAGKRLLPGAVDAHVHFREPGATHRETWATGSRAAAAGGVTTAVDQPNTDPPTVTGAAFDAKAARAADALIDWGINGGVVPGWEPDALFDRPLTALGEVFLADSTGGMGIGGDLFREAAGAAAAAGVTVTVHAEDAGRFADPPPEGGPAGRAADADRWSAYRPPAAETAAIETAVDAAADAGAELHVAHTSTPEGVDAAAAAGATCEVTPHHLYLSRDDLDRLGTYGRMNPPLRDEGRRRGLFDRVADGTVDVVATDHAPHTVAEKERPLADAPSGVPGVETMLPLLLASVRRGDLSLERVRDLTAAAPARRFGLPDKGRVAVGTDADLVLVDLTEPREVRAAGLHSNCGWTPFEGMTGVFPELTLVRGTVVYRRDPVTGAESFGPAVGRNVRAPA